ncbi:MAG: insulinase family protein [Planctomycetes bacterium]|nr:insulinase family protein [Planctomycetota bacterium]
MPTIGIALMHSTRLAFAIGWSGALLLAGCRPHMIPERQNPAPEERAPGAAAAHPDHLVFPPLRMELPRPKRVELPNGLVLHLLENHDLPLCDVRVLIRTGFASESPEQQGLHELLAGAIRLGGTSRRTGAQLDAALDAVGATLDLSMEQEQCVATLRVRKKDLGLGLELLADLLQHAALPPESIEVKRGLMQDAIARLPDSPRTIAPRAFRHLVYGNHPYANDGLGTAETVGAFTRDDLAAAYVSEFGPNRTAIGIAGDFSADGVAKDLERLFGSWPRIATLPEETPAVAREPAGDVALVRRPLDQSTIWVGHTGISWSNPDYYDVQVMNWILGGGSFASRLTSRVRSTGGLAYGVRSSFAPAREAGLFTVVTQTKAGSTHQALSLVLNTLQGMAASPVSSQEVEQAKAAILENFIFRFDLPIEVVTEYMDAEFRGYPRDWLQNYRANIATVTPSRVAAAAKKYLHPDQSQVLVIGDPERFDFSLDDIGRVHELPADPLARPAPKAAPAPDAGPGVQEPASPAPGK